MVHILYTHTPCTSLNQGPWEHAFCMLVSLSKRDGGNVMECTGSCNWHWKLSHLLSAQGTYMKICKHMQQWEQLLSARTAVGAWTSLFFWTLWDLCSILFPAQRLICWNCMCVSVSTQHTHKQYTQNTNSYRLLPLLPTLTIRSRVTGWDGCKDQFFVATQLLNRPDCHHDCWSNDLCLARKKGYHSHPTWKFNQLNTIDESTVQRLQKLGLSQVLQG